MDDGCYGIKIAKIRRDREWKRSSSQRISGKGLDNKVTITVQ
jgi:hypothetical protein